MPEPIKVEVRPDGDTWVADRPALAGSPVVGRGKTWLEALGDLMIQDVATFGVRAFVYDRDGNLVPPEFFGPGR